MKIYHKLNSLRRYILNYIISIFPIREYLNPVFIIGCGRSGTTILGTALSKHEKITYLNERRDLWFSAYPETDIWTKNAINKNGKIALDSSNCNMKKNEKLRRLFKIETIVSGKPILIEKLPINNFRLKFILTIFPNARFIHIYRNGLEVSKSIEKLSKEGKWFGANDYKWKQLIEVANLDVNTKYLPKICSNDFEKGLLEWRLSTEAVVNFLESIPKDKYLEISYNSMTEHPISVIKKVLTFIGVSDDESVTKFINEKISRRSDNLNNIDLNVTEKVIGGKLLPISLNSHNGLV